MTDSRKRRNSKPYDEHGFSKKKFDFLSVVGHRFLIPAKAAGNIIGKGGEVIKRLRSQFSCRIMVPDSDGPERMLIIDADTDTVIDVWNDIVAYVKDCINAKECDYKNSGNKQIDEENEIDVRMIVHESQAGALIGKGGERIRSMIDSHKMTIIKLYQALCPHSTDRIVRLVSTPGQLMECLRNMLRLLENQIVKGPRTDFDPNNFDENLAPSYGGFLSKDTRMLPRISNNRSSGDHRVSASEYNMPRHTAYDRVSHVDKNNPVYYGGSYSRDPEHDVNENFYDGAMRMPANNDVHNHESRIAVPIHLVNAILGTDGHRLSDIKRDSGAQIHLDDQSLNDREELFLIRGTADQVYKAQCLMQLCARKYGVVDQYGY